MRRERTYSSSRDCCYSVSPLRESRLDALRLQRKAGTVERRRRRPRVEVASDERFNSGKAKRTQLLHCFAIQGEGFGDWAPAAVRALCIGARELLLQLRKQDEGLFHCAPCQRQFLPLVLGPGRLHYGCSQVTSSLAAAHLHMSSSTMLRGRGLWVPLLSPANEAAVAGVFAAQANVTDIILSSSETRRFKTTSSLSPVELQNVALLGHCDQIHLGAPTSGSQ